VDLEALPFELKAKFRLQFADGLEADITKGANKIGKHDQFERHGRGPRVRILGRNLNGIKAKRTIYYDFGQLQP
jgi:hypothetical protein